MAIRRTTMSAGVGVLLLCSIGAVGCSSGGSARTDYFAARNIQRGALPGDGSVVAFGPRAGDSSWSASLSFAPTRSADGTLAAGE